MWRAENLHEDKSNLNLDRITVLLEDPVVTKFVLSGWCLEGAASVFPDKSSFLMMLTIFWSAKLPYIVMLPHPCFTAGMVLVIMPKQFSFCFIGPENAPLKPGDNLQASVWLFSAQGRLLCTTAFQVTVMSDSFKGGFTYFGVWCFFRDFKPLFVTCILERVAR